MRGNCVTDQMNSSKAMPSAHEVHPPKQHPRIEVRTKHSLVIHPAKASNMTDYPHISGDTTGREKLIAHMTAKLDAEGGTVVDATTVFHANSRFGDFSSTLDDNSLWRLYDEFDVCHITTDGDLVFDIRDAFAPAGFGSGDLVHY